MKMPIIVSFPNGIGSERFTRNIMELIDDANDDNFIDRYIAWQRMCEAERERGLKPVAAQPTE